MMNALDKHHFRPYEEVKHLIDLLSFLVPDIYDVQKMEENSCQ